MRSWVLVVMLGACARRHSLAEVPVYGGTEDQRRQLVAELATWDRWVGHDRVRLTRVDLVPAMANGAAGRYIGAKDRIELLDDDTTPTDGLRHELCHAIHHQDRLAVGDQVLFDWLAWELHETGRIQTWLYRTADEQHNEAYAVLCAAGPLALDALAHPCPGDPLRLTSLARWTVAEVYRSYVPSEPFTLGDGAVTADAWDSGTKVGAAPHAGRAVLERYGDGEGLQYDLYSGALLDLPSAEIVEPEDRDIPILRGVVAPWSAGWPAGPAAARGKPFFEIDPAADDRLFAYDVDEGDWARADACLEDVDFEVFAADGQVWAAWTDDPLVRWQAISE